MTYNNLAFNPEVCVLVEPDFDSCLCLEEFEDQEDGPDHETLQLARLIFLHVLLKLTF